MRGVSVALTGASGIIYGLRLIECLSQCGEAVHVMISAAARVVADMETDTALTGTPDAVRQTLAERLRLGGGPVTVYAEQQWSSALASGSNAPRRMAVCPCTTGTLAAIADGHSNSLIERAADVVIKERGRLVLVPRETPLSAIHLEHMLRLSRLGAVILPAAPGFYHRPQGVPELIDFVVARTLDHLDVEHDLGPRWGQEERRE